MATEKFEVSNCGECPCSYRHPYDEELECSLSATEPYLNGTRRIVDCAEGLNDLPHNCPLRKSPVLVCQKGYEPEPDEGEHPDEVDYFHHYFEDEDGD